ncbi:MAG: hypothetical protein Q8M83_02995 [bacterium]|nr:hypothetical protein [bacterium]
MTDITCIDNDKRNGLQIYKRPMPTSSGNPEETVFFGIIWTDKAKLTKEIHNLYQEVTEPDQANIAGQEEIFFEKSLQKINILLQRHEKENKNDFNLLFGLKCKNKILFSQKGKIFSLLIDRKTANNIVVSPLSGLLNKSEEDRFFPHFAAGNLNFHQSVFFSTDNVSTYFTPVRLATLLFSSGNALWQIRDSVAKLDPNLPFGALHLLHKEKEQAAERSLSSIKDLNATAAQTEKILTPPILPNFSPMFKNTGGILVKKIGALAGWLIGIFKKSSPSVRAQTGQYSSLAAKNIRYGFVFVLLKTRQGLLYLVSHRPSSLISLLIAKFNNLQLGAKILTIAFVTLVFLFIQSMAYLSHTTGSRGQQKMLTDTVAEVQNHLTQVNAALIYGDENKARTFLEAAQKAFDVIKQNPRFKNQEQKNQLTGEIKKYGDTLRKLYVLQTQTLFEFSDQKEPEGMTLLGADLYLLSDNSLLKLDRSKKILDVIYQNLSLNFKYLATDADKKSLLLFDPDKGAVIEYVPANKSSNEIKLPAMGQIINVDIYGRRVYVLGGNPLSLYRLAKSDKEFVSAAWLKEKVDLSGGASLAVDGDLYVLKNSGELLKLQSGRKKDFSLTGIKPALGVSNKIFTDENSDYLYVWETQNQRLAVFDKKGRLAAQYQAPEAGAIKDFAVEEKTKKVFLLTDKGVFEAGLNNLK